MSICGKWDKWITAKSTLCRVFFWLEVFLYLMLTIVLVYVVDCIHTLVQEIIIIFDTFRSYFSLAICTNH